MDFLSEVINVFLHLDKYLGQVVSDYGFWAYLILFLIIFVETGLVVMPFLPGDSLLFAAGAIAALGAFDVYLLGFLLIIAAFLGDGVNYHIGKFFGPKVFKRDYRFLKREHLMKTQLFYEKHGGKTIIIARFIPIIRTFAPFIAGVGLMQYRRFIIYNLTGGILWVASFLALGYIVGNDPVVKKNFSLVILGIIIISVMPPLIEFLRNKYSNNTTNS